MVTIVTACTIKVFNRAFWFYKIKEHLSSLFQLLERLQDKTKESFKCCTVKDMKKAIMVLFSTIDKLTDTFMYLFCTNNASK